MDIIYDGELDPYSGVDQHPSTLPGVITELKVLLLSHDVVVVPPRHLFEHALALPAFEALAPFVRAGALTTTADRAYRRPVDFIDEQVNRYLQGPERTGPVAVAAGLRREIPFPKRHALMEMRARWLDLVPARWTLSRRVSDQVESFGVCVEHLAEEQPGNAACRILLEALDRTRQAGREPHREGGGKTPLFA